MNRDLMLAILSMDSYNRGYGNGIKGLLESGAVGSASIRPFGINEQNGWEAAGFYAIAYDWNGEKVIAYRGTNDFSVDGPNGYPIGAGFDAVPQPPPRLRVSARPKTAPVSGHSPLSYNARHMLPPAHA